MTEPVLQYSKNLRLLTDLQQTYKNISVKPRSLTVWKLFSFEALWAGDGQWLNRTKLEHSPSRLDGQLS